jgi:hypothetical protein
MQQQMFQRPQVFVLLWALFLLSHGIWQMVSPKSWLQAFFEVDPTGLAEKRMVPMASMLGFLNVIVALFGGQSLRFQDNFGFVVRIYLCHNILVSCVTVFVVNFHEEIGVDKNYGYSLIILALFLILGLSSLYGEKRCEHEVKEIPTMVKVFFIAAGIAYWSCALVFGSSPPMFYDLMFKEDPEMTSVERYQLMLVLFGCFSTDGILGLIILRGYCAPTKRLIGLLTIFFLGMAGYLSYLEHCADELKIHEEFHIPTIIEHAIIVILGVVALVQMPKEEKYQEMTTK